MPSPKKWPDEAPVFRVIKDGSYLAEGAIVEGVQIGDDIIIDEERFIADRCGATDRDYIGVRLPDGNGGTFFINRHPSEGWVGCIILARLLEPLTPAARDWIRFAKEGR